MQTRDKPSIDTPEPVTPAIAETPTQKGWQSWIAPWWKAFLAILPVFLITRLIFILLTYFGVILFTVPNYSLQSLSLDTLLQAWSRWDANVYANIAANGYISLKLAAFFPLYPWLEHIVSLALHGNTNLAGMFISSTAFCGTLIVLYRFVEMEFDSETAKRTTLYLAIFPTALFFFAGYNESLFLLFVLLAFYTMRRGSWWLAGLFGGLAALTRAMGVALLLIFLYEFVRQVLPQVRSTWKEHRRWQLLKQLADLPAALLIPLGLAIFVYYLKLRFNDPLAFAHAQVYWHHGLTKPWHALITVVKSLSVSPPISFPTAHNIIDLSALLIFLTLLILGFVGPERFARHQWSMLFFGFPILLYPLFFPARPDATGIHYDVLPSTQRYVLEIFPAFIMLARFGRREWFHQNYLFLALPMLAFFTLQFITFHWTV